MHNHIRLTVMENKTPHQESAQMVRLVSSKIQTQERLKGHFGISPFFESRQVSCISFSPFNSCLSVVLQLDKVDYPEDSYAVFCQNTVLSNLLCVWILF